MTWVRSHWIAIVTAAVLFFVGIGIGAAGGSDESATETTTVTNTQVKTRTQVKTKTVVQTKTAEAAGPSGSIEGDGTFLVGEDVAPGTYRAAAASSGNCYWARLKDLNGNVNSIVANGNTSGPVLLRVAPSDYAIETTGCETFKRIG
jgi:hypothetical protein